MRRRQCIQSVRCTWKASGIDRTESVGAERYRNRRIERDRDREDGLFNTHLIIAGARSNASILSAYKYTPTTGRGNTSPWISRCNLPRGDRKDASPKGKEGGIIFEGGRTWRSKRNLP